VDALQAFAAKTKRQIEEQDARIDQSKAIGRHFRSHFPDIGRQFDRWGSTGHAEKERRFWELMRVEETRLDLSMQAVNLLAALAQGSVAFDDVTWELDNTTVTARNPIWGYWQVATRPQGAAFADIVESVRDSAARLRALPAVTDYIETTRQVEVLRAALLDALDTVMTNQQPRGHCDGCPRG
jgi:hypothetical protein